MRRIVTLALALGAVAAFAPAASAGESTYKTAHFALTWPDDASGTQVVDPTDDDDDGIPDAVERMATAFESARAFLLDDLGYVEPPTHGRMDIFVSTTTQQGETRVVPGGEGRSRPSAIIVPSRLMQAKAATGEVKSVAVHEYFHAVQNGYDSAEDHWIAEASSAWAEGLFAPHAHTNYGYLHDFVPNPELGLASSSGIHPYGAFLWLQYLTERYGDGGEMGASIVRDLWDAMAVPEGIEGAPDDDSFEAITRVLGDRGVTVADAWREFLLWRWELLRFEQGRGYRRALRSEPWPVADELAVTAESCRVSPEAPLGTSLPALSGSYRRFVPELDGRHNAWVTAQGPPGSVAFALVKPVQGRAVLYPLTFGDDGLATTTIPFGGTDATRVIVASGNGTTAGSLPAAAYSVRVDGESATNLSPPAAPSSTIFGTAVSISGRVSCNGAPAPFARVRLLETEVASGETTAIDLVTDAFGTWSLVSGPEVNSTYAVDLVDPLLSSATSTSTTVGVRVAVNMRVSSDQVAEGESVTVDGNVAPAHAGTVVVEIRRPSGPWQAVTTAELDSAGAYSTSISFPSTGTWEVRARMPDTGDRDHLPGDSVPRLVQVGQS
jgi:hypothetical protein